MTKHTILVVEDEQDIRELLAYHLEKDGFKVLEASNGKKALELVQAEKPQIVLLDIMLPDMDGMSICR